MRVCVVRCIGRGRCARDVGVCASVLSNAEGGAGVRDLLEFAGHGTAPSFVRFQNSGRIMSPTLAKPESAVSLATNFWPLCLLLRAKWLMDLQDFARATREVAKDPGEMER